MPNFTVDTHLFRELGELLVGRDSTALVELIKNSYDADATHVTVYGYGLDAPDTGRIVITDDGVGMRSNQFIEGFLRVASRFKSEGASRSARYGRRYTGAKGIGRLAAHKLARLINISSIPWEANNSGVKPIVASIDWDIVESYSTIKDLEGSDAIVLTEEPLMLEVKSGTTITLSRLRRRWTPSERARFFAEVTNFTPPKALVDPPAGVAQTDLLFQRPTVRDVEATDPGFDIELLGEFDVGEDYWQALARTASWILEIDANKENDKNGQVKATVTYSLLPTNRLLQQYPDAERRVYEMDHPNPQDGPFFQSRILVREGVVKGQDIPKAWLGRSSGIRVFMEGFRVLPYGEPNNDWLQIDYSYSQRDKHYYALDEFFPDKSDNKNEGLVALRSTSYFGAVFLTSVGSPNLRMLVNREGFIPEVGYELLVRLIRNGIDLLTRVRAQVTEETRNQRREDRQSNAVNASIKPNTRAKIELAVQRAKELASEARTKAAEGDYHAASHYIDLAAVEFTQASELSEMMITEGALLRVLASVGTQMTAFVHEINGLLGTAISLESAFEGLSNDTSLPSSTKRRINQIRSTVGDLRRGIERQASYLVDVISPDSRRRRSRQKLSERFEAAKRLVEPLAARRNVEIINEIPGEIKSPPMFPAEVAIVFSNLLTNALKAAGPSGRIHVSARQDGERIKVRMENTGAKVDPIEGEKWFKPFESTTVETDPVLGQGMGMGLPITRNILSEYGAEIHFVVPDSDYATAIEAIFQE